MTNIVDEQTSTLDSSTFNSPPFFGTSWVPKHFAQYDGKPCQHFSSYIKVHSTSFKSALMTPQHSNTILTRVQAQNSASRALQKKLLYTFPYPLPVPTTHPTSFDSKNVYNLPTNVDTVFPSWLTSSPLHALTSKVDKVSGLSPNSLVMTVVVEEPSTNTILQKLFSLSQKWTW